LLTCNEMHLISQVKMLGLVACITAMVAWVGASLESTAPKDVGQDRADMRDEVLGLTFWFFAGMGAFLAHSLGTTRIIAAAQSSKVALRVLELVQGEWAKACYLFCFAPFLLVHAGVRRLLGDTDSTEPEPTEQVEQTEQSAVAWRAVKCFRGRFMQQLWTTSVLLKAQWVGIGYVSFVVGIKVTMVLLAYTNELLASLNIVVVSFAVFAIGVFLFLLPPTPGAPVYAIIGIVVTSSAQNSGWSPVLGIVWAIFIGSAVKMAFCAIAQKCIGEPLAQSVTVRSLVQVHTTELRAIEMILKEPGITIAKVSILIGGPDWPVAVLCGILRLPLGKILFATSPVLLQSVAPCVLSGSLLIIFAGDEKKKVLGETAVAVAGALQVAVMIAAGYYIQSTVELEYDALQKERPQDHDVIALEKESADKDALFQERTKLPTLPDHVRGMLVAGIASSYASCLLLAGPWKMFWGIACFRKFEITSTVEEALGGNPFEMVQPLGWIAIALCLLSTGLLAGFYSWAQNHVHALPAEKSNPGYAVLGDPATPSK